MPNRHPALSIPPEAAHLRRAIAALCLLASSLAAVVLLAELIHRLRLSQGYGHHPGLNHVADGYFTTIYAAAFLATASALAALSLFHTRLPRRLAVVLTFLQLCLALSFFLMHHTAALVEYSEFVKVYGP